MHRRLLRTMSGYRPQLRWLALGPLLGALCGSVVAYAVLLGGYVTGGSAGPSVTDLLEGLGPLAVLALVFGGLSGVAVGTVCGAAQAVLVGRHLTARAARRRSLVLGAVLPPVVLVALASALAGEPVSTSVPLLLATGLSGGGLAARAESRLLPHDGVS